MNCALAAKLALGGSVIAIAGVAYCKQQADTSWMAQLLSNSHLKTESYPYDKDGIHLGLADGIWELSDGSHPIEPEQVSIMCIKQEGMCTVESVKLKASQQQVEIDYPDETYFKISEWSTEGITASHGPDPVDKCHHSVLLMNFKTSEVSMTDIPADAEGCRFNKDTNTWHLAHKKYYVEAPMASR